MRVAAVQFRAVPGPKAVALERLRLLALRAAPAADLVVLPELAATPYLFPRPALARVVAEPPDGPTLAALAPVARRHRCWIVVGFVEDAGARMHNSALVIGPGGALRCVYRKSLLFPPDAWWCHPGEGAYPAFDTGVGRFGVGICMDLNDPTFVGWCREACLDAVAFPTNWLEEGAPVWPYWASRLAGTGAALVAANTYGREGPLRFAGRSAILTEEAILAAAPPEGDAVVIATLG